MFLTDFPIFFFSNQIFVDKENEMVFLPLFGYSVPFHISVIKNINKTDEEYIRINFVTSETSDTKTEENKSNITIKEVSYRFNTTNPLVLSQTVFGIKDLKKSFGSFQTQLREEKDLIRQEDLILARGKTKKNKEQNNQKIFILFHIIWSNF